MQPRSSIASENLRRTVPDGVPLWMLIYLVTRSSRTRSNSMQMLREAGCIGRV
jgi:hypothetical protein